MGIAELGNVFKQKAQLKALHEELKDFDGVHGQCYGEIRLLAKSDRRIRDKVTDLVVKRDQIREEITKRYEAYLDSVQAADKVLAGIDDDIVRAIFYYHDCQGNRWAEVAKKIGGTATADSVKKCHERYLKKSA